MYTKAVRPSFQLEKERIMILGLSTSTFTLLHVIISLIGILAGLIVLVGLLANRYSKLMTGVFLLFTILTSVTGFFFHSKVIGPPHILGGISLVILAITLVALYGGKLAGVWRPIYVITAIIALYLNVFVLVAQLFQKVPALNAFAPTGKEPPFAVAQGVVLILFIVLTLLAVRRFRTASPA
jgi:hypothetical protein